MSIDGQIYAEIAGGFLVLLGISERDGTAEADYIIRKLPLLRIFADDNLPINRSLNDVG